MTHRRPFLASLAASVASAALGASLLLPAAAQAQSALDEVMAKKQIQMLQLKKVNKQRQKCLQELSQLGSMN